MRLHVFFLVLRESVTLSSVFYIWIFDEDKTQIKNEYNIYGNMHFAILLATSTFRDAFESV